MQPEGNLAILSPLLRVQSGPANANHRAPRPLDEGLILTPHWPKDSFGRSWPRLLRPALKFGLYPAAARRYRVGWLPVPCRVGIPELLQNPSRRSRPSRPGHAREGWNTYPSARHCRRCAESLVMIARCSVPGNRNSRLRRNVFRLRHACIRGGVLLPHVTWPEPRPAVDRNEGPMTFTWDQ